MTADRKLILMHLRKTFDNIIKANFEEETVVVREFDYFNERLLPLFTNVTNLYGKSELIEQFPEIFLFMSKMTTILVQEIRLRAGNNSTVLAANAIAEFLSPLKGVTNGWELLQSVTYLVTSNNNMIIEAACHASLPSTIVKSLYLFFDLSNEYNNDLSHAREKLKLNLESLITFLFRHKVSVDELILKDDLPLTFIGASTLTTPLNNYWRDLNLKIIKQIFEHTLTPTIIKYIKVRECFTQYLVNIEGTTHLPDNDQIDAIVTLISLLKSSTKCGNGILELFSIIGGYDKLVQYIIQRQSKEEVVKKIINVIGKELPFIGISDIKPIYPNNIHDKEFNLPKPLGCGMTLWNIMAIKCLYNVFLLTKSDVVSEVIANIIRDIYTKDPSNYFLGENDFELVKFFEGMETKNIQIQLPFFEILEFLLREVEYVPRKELTTLSVILRNQLSLERYNICNMYMKKIFVLLTLHSSLKDIFTDIGFIETFTWIFNLSIDILKKNNTKNFYIQMVLPIMDLLNFMIKGHPFNAQLISDKLESSKIIENLCIDNENSSNNMAILLKNLLIFTKNEKYMRLVMQTLTNNPSSYKLNNLLLNVLLSALKESHKVRISFRKVEGYSCLISSLLNFESNFIEPLFTEEFKKSIDYISLIFKVITISMRFEPSNSKYFSQEIKFELFTSIIRLTGAFTQTLTIPYNCEKITSSQGFLSALRSIHVIFKSSIFEEEYDDNLTVDIPDEIILVCYFLKQFLEMAFDSIDRSPNIIKFNDINNINIEGSSDNVTLIDIGQSPIVHTNGMLCFISLLASIPITSSPFISGVTQFYGFVLLKDCLKHERNQQVMCTGQLPKLLLDIAEEVFNNENHLLYPPIIYIFERLARQQIFPRDLKKFLRLGNPLCCRDLDDEIPQNINNENKEGGSLDFYRVKALASMLTPRYNSSFELPPFIEFDLSYEGFASLLVPSIAPQQLQSSSPVSTNHIFPPLNGLTLTTWIYIHGNNNENNINKQSIILPLINIFRSFKGQTDDSSKVNFRNMISCFNAELNINEMTISVSTCEMEFLRLIDHVSRGIVIEGQVQGSVKNLIKKEQWNNIGIVLTKSVLKNSTIEIYINSELVLTQKIHYISANSVHPITKTHKQTGVHALIGVSPFTRKLLNLKWKMSNYFLFEEPLSYDAIKKIHSLGANYVGNLQAIEPDGTQLIEEDKIIFSLNASANFECSVMKLKNMYPRIDYDILANLLSVSINDNSTPLRVLWNTANIGNYDSRSYGGVTIGYLGIRVFHPLPASKILSSIGGELSILGLIAMSTTSEELYISMKALLSALQTSTTICESMLENRGYQMLAMLLEDKGHIMNANILHLVISLTETASLNVSNNRLIHKSHEAFEDLLCDLDVWSKASENFRTILFEHLYEMIIDPQKESVVDAKKSTLLQHLLIFLLDSPSPIAFKTDTIFNLITVLLQGMTDSKKILCYGQALAGTIPSSTSEQVIEETFPFLTGALKNKLIDSSNSGEIDKKLYFVYIRNRLLNILFTALSNAQQNISCQMGESIVKNLGFDWLFTFFIPSIHPCTFFTALRILLEILKHQSILQKFKNGQNNGEWLADADSATKNRVAVLLGFSVNNTEQSTGVSLGINKEVLACSGYEFLFHLLPNHYDKPFAIIGIFSILFNQSTSFLTNNSDLTTESIWSEVFSLNKTGSITEIASNVEVNSDALPTLTKMLNILILNNNDNDVNEENLMKWSQIIVNIIIFFYQNSPNFYNTINMSRYFVCVFKILYSYTENKEIIAEYYKPSVKLLYDFISSILINDLFINHEIEGGFLLDSLIENISDTSSVFSTSKSPFSTIVNLYLEILRQQPSFINYKITLIPKQVKLYYESSSILSNIFYTITRLIDCCWLGYIHDNSYKILEILLRVMQEIKQVYSSTQKNNIVIEDIYINSFFRIVLYILSRPINNINSQLSVLDTLSQLLHNVHFFVNSHSSNNTYFGPLIHLIFVLSETPDLFYNPNQNVELEKGSAQIAVCAGSVWEMIYQYRSKFLNDLFKQPVDDDILTSRVTFGGIANGFWLNFLDSQQDIDMSLSKFTNIFKSNFGSRLTRMGSTFSKLTTKKGLTAAAINAVSSAASVTSSTFSGSSGKDSSIDGNILNRSDSISSVSFTDSITRNKDSPTRTIRVTKEMLHTSIKIHICFVKEAINSQISSYHEYHNHVRKWCIIDWEKNRAELIRPKGLWGPEKCSKYQKYQLSTVEGPFRVRKKTFPDSTFYHRYPYRPQMDTIEGKLLRNKVALCRDSKIYYEKMHKHRFLTMDERIIDKSLYSLGNGSNNEETIQEFNNEVTFSMIRRLAKSNKDMTNSKEDDDQEEIIDNENQKKDIIQGNENNTEETNINNQKKAFGPDNQSLLRLLEPGEQLHSMFRCARVQGLDTMEGLILFGKEYCYVIDGFTLLKTREIRDLEFLPEQFHDPIVPYTALGGSNRTKSARQCHKIAYDDIASVHRRRYMLQPISIEIFCHSGENFLLAFPKRTRNRVYQKFTAISKSDDTSKQGLNPITAPNKRFAYGEQLAETFINSIIGQQSITKKWVKGEISNFEYLIYLNTVSGRSYNDLSQYPIFPWIIQDYTSDKLDLQNPKTFRDLSKPMGAQSAERLNQFLKRYSEWDDPSHETPPYMYGTHYSSAMIVLSFMVRVEPFTTQFLKLQGGHFDLADRMFHSIEDSFISASKNNMADVRELIPEFFYLPELFKNENNFDFGNKQNGVLLNDVILPPWAKGDPSEFVRMHREALECDYVSEHLHEWIDLIFGYKQIGEDAIKAHNVFHHLFYEGSVDFDNINDPLTKNATLGFINNFGQIPTQLFKKPHPQRKPQYNTPYNNTNGTTTNQCFYHNLDALKPFVKPVKELGSAIGTICFSDKGHIIALEHNKVMINSVNFVSWGFNDKSLRIGNVENDKSMTFFELNDNVDISCMASGNNKLLFGGLITGGIHVWSICNKWPRLKYLKHLLAHTDAVTVMVVSKSFNLLISGSRDGSVILWNPETLNFVRQLDNHGQSITAIQINEISGDIGTASGSMMYIWSINGTLLSSIDTSDSKGSLTSSRIILCISFSTINEYDSQNVIMCGRNDGLVLIYSMEMIKSDKKNDNNLKLANTIRELTSPKIFTNANTIKDQLFNKNNKGKLLSISSLNNDKDEGLGCDSNTTSISLNNEKIVKKDSHDSDDNQDINELNIWRRELILRKILGLHTAFNKITNQRPAPITAILPAKDHKKLYIGDGVGRILLWALDTRQLTEQ
ncbi:Blue cheese [Strongyloides ratti]|uniref:Blue cheese n=1 Tax=Strongyloides ratti TaxID=34506 RepID=A0A090MMR8_STRRB|nr:Blue cheese [Strongyloides ratti]CEF59316.1 Blue cheese [Strongyloides ratti]